MSLFCIRLCFTPLTPPGGNLGVKGLGGKWPIGRPPFPPKGELRKE
jgi:hypothetical protein